MTEELVLFKFETVDVLTASRELTRVRLSEESTKLRGEQTLVNLE